MASDREHRGIHPVVLHRARDAGLVVRSGAGSSGRGHAPVAVAARDLHVHPWRVRAYSLEHARVMDVRSRSGAVLGNAALPELLLLLRNRRGSMRSHRELSLPYAWGR